MGVVLRRTMRADPAFVLLTGRLDDELWSRYGHTPPAYEGHPGFEPDAVVIADDADLPIGCGALRRHGKREVQLARVYVVESRRGLGTARAIVRELETWAVELGAQRAVVEVGLRQPEILELYEASGFQLLDGPGSFGAEERAYALRKVLRR